MPLAAGPLWVFSALVLVSGVAKLISPAATSGALRASGLPSSWSAVRLLGGVEVAVGAYAVLAGDRLAGVAVALLYAGFTLFVVNALVRGLPVSSCGCFGREDTPPSWIHVGVTAIGVAAGTAALVRPPGPVDDALQAAESLVMTLIMIGIAFAFAYISLTTLPKTLGLTRRS